MNTPVEDARLDLTHANEAGEVSQIDYVSATRVIPFHISRQPKHQPQTPLDMERSNFIPFHDSQDTLVRVLAGSLEQW